MGKASSGSRRRPKTIWPSCRRRCGRDPTARKPSNGSTSPKAMEERGRWVPGNHLSVLTSPSEAAILQGNNRLSIFIERLWRSLKHDDYLKHYADGREARADLDSLPPVFQR